MIKIENLDDALNRLLNKIDKSPQDLVFFAAKQAERILKFRIFNEGKTTSGQMFGRYKTKSWKKERQDKGRQTVYKDLNMTGDLKDSIRVSRRKKSANVRFANEKFREIAAGQTNQIGRGEIFRLSEQEAEKVIELTTKQAIKEIRKMIKESFR